MEPLGAVARRGREGYGLAESDRLALLALVTTGLRRSELCSLEWRDLELNRRRRSLLVRYGKSGKSRRQPLPPRLAQELLKLRHARERAPGDPVFCGLAGRRLQETILADIVRRAAKRAGIDKHVTAHTPRRTAATWLRQELGDTRLVAEYLGHADLSTVVRYAHVDRDEPFAAGRSPGASRRSRGTNRRRRPMSSWRVTLSRIFLLRPKTAPTTPRPSRSGRVDDVVVAAAAVDWVVS